MARDNARRHGVLDRVHFLQADLLAALKPTATFALMVANLPYVPRAEWEQLPQEIKAFEPSEALLGGEDGLDLIRPLIRQAQQYVQGGGWLLLEVGDQQAAQVVALVAETGAYDRLGDHQGFQRYGAGGAGPTPGRRRLESLYTLQHNAHFIIAVSFGIGIARMGIVTFPAFPGVNLEAF